MAIAKIDRVLKALRATEGKPGEPFQVFAEDVARKAKVQRRTATQYIYVLNRAGVIDKVKKGARNRPMLIRIPVSIATSPDGTTAPAAKPTLRPSVLDVIEQMFVSCDHCGSPVPGKKFSSLLRAVHV